MPRVATQRETPQVNLANAPNQFNYQRQTPTVASATTLPSSPPSQSSTRTGVSAVTPQTQTPTVLSAQAGRPTLQLSQQGAAPQFALPGQGLAT